MRAAGYYRVSCKRQAERESIETQKATMRPWFEKKGFEVTEFEDDGISGEDLEKRPGFRDLLDRLGKKEFEALFVFHVDRIGRFKRRGDRTRVMEVIEDNKIVVYVFDGETEEVYDPKNEDDMDELEKELMDSRKESRRRARKISAGLKRVKGQGRYGGGETRYGIRWNRVEQKYEINEAEHTVLKETFRLLRSGYGLFKVVKIFNSDLEKHPTRHGKPWHKGTIQQMVNSDFYFAGILVQNRGEKDGKRKPKEEWIQIDTGLSLFTEQEVREARHQISLRRKWGKKGRSPKVVADFLLQGLAICGECGARLSIQTYRRPSRIYRYYRCPNADRGICSFRAANADEADSQAWHLLMRDLTDPEALEEAIVGEEFIPESRAKDLTALIRKADDELRELCGKEERTKELYIEGKYPREKYNAKMREIEKAKREATDTKRKVRQTLERPDELRKAIRAAVKEVSIDAMEIALGYEFHRKLAEFAKLPWEEQERIEREEPDHPWAKFSQKLDEYILKERANRVSPRTQEFIFRQKKRIMDRFLAGRGGLGFSVEM